MVEWNYISWGGEGLADSPPHENTTKSLCMECPE